MGECDHSVTIMKQSMVEVCVECNAVIPYLQLQKLTTECDRLKEEKDKWNSIADKLGEYADHKHTCLYFHRRDKDCTCGLEDILKQFEANKEE